VGEQRDLGDEHEPATGGVGDLRVHAEEPA